MPPWIQLLLCKLPFLKSIQYIIEDCVSSSQTSDSSGLEEAAVPLSTLSRIDPLLFISQTGVNTSYVFINLSFPLGEEEEPSQPEIKKEERRYIFLSNQPKRKSSEKK